MVFGVSFAFEAEGLQVGGTSPKQHDLVPLSFRFLGAEEPNAPACIGPNAPMPLMEQFTY